MMPRLAIVAAACIGFAVAGYAKGRIDERASHTAAALEQAQADAKVTADLAAAEQTNRLLAQALEDAAYAEPPSVDCGLPRSRVLRLRER
jgi:hypothetical protein